MAIWLKEGKSESEIIEADEKVKGIARAVWTQDLINQYQKDSKDTLSR